jgi:uncharacterized protein
MRKPLTVPLASLKQGENRLSFELEPADLDFRPREVAENPSFEFFVGPVQVEFAITRSGDRLLLAGSVRYRARLDCALCGCAYEAAFDEPVSTEFLSHEPAGVEHRIEPEELDQVSLRGNSIDLLPLVRDAIHLAVPIAPQCRPECLGLCPECGANLNEGPCECVAVRRARRYI